MVTIQAGSSTNQKRSMTGALIVSLSLLAGVASAQTGQALGGPKFTAQLNNGDPCNGCKLFAYVGGTTTKQDTYTSSTLGTPNANPVVLDSAGRATVFLDPTKIYKFVLAPSTDTDPPAAALWTMDNVTGQFSGVITVTAANTRGVQIARSGANAGLSIASSGGSGKTYGIVSDTTGALLIQDDSDSTPQVKLTGNDITATLTGNFSVSGGLIQQSGKAGDHQISGTTNGPNRLGIRNTSNGTAALSSFMLGTDAAVNTGALFALSSGYTTSGSYVADGVSVEATRAGGLSLNASNAAGDVRIYTGGNTTPRATFVDNGAIFFGQTTGTRDMELRSTGDGLTGGFVVTRSDGSELLVNADDGAPGGGFGTIQARDGSGYLPTKLSPSGGGVSVGGGGTVAAILTGTTTWDPPNINSASAASTTVTVTGVQSNSPCFGGISSMVASYAIAMSAHYDGAANTVRFVLTNQSGSAMDLGSGTVRVTCFTY